VAGYPLDLLDLFDGKLSVLTDTSGRLGRYHSERNPRVGNGQLYVKPPFESMRIVPQLAHSGKAIAFNHGGPYSRGTAGIPSTRGLWGDANPDGLEAMPLKIVFR
jgi:hypothetical protein